MTRRLTAPRTVTTPLICRAVASHFGVSAEEIMGPSQSRSICAPRNVAVYLARRVAGRTYSQIGRALGGRNHTTIMHSERWIRLRLHQPGMMRDLTAIAELIGRRVAA